jgi:hypothetical protein
MKIPVERAPAVPRATPPAPSILCSPRAAAGTESHMATIRPTQTHHRNPRLRRESSVRQYREMKRSIVTTDWFSVVHHPRAMMPEPVLKTITPSALVKTDVPRSAQMFLEMFLSRGASGCRSVLRGAVKFPISLGSACSPALLPRWTSRVRLPSPAQPNRPETPGIFFVPDPLSSPMCLFARACA